MNASPLLTKDGSYTLQSSQYNVPYHSIFGAVEESILVFISAGLQPIILKGQKNISILEIGLGTGLNALLSYLTAKRVPDIQINYTAYEAFPITVDIAKQLEYCSYLNCTELQGDFEAIHASQSSEFISFDQFRINIINQKFETITDVNQYDIIYFDAFAPTVQAELWGETMMQKMCDALKPSGLLTSYCAKGSFKRALKAVGFEVESLPGPAKKREMTRAWKH